MKRSLQSYLKYLCIVSIVLVMAVLAIMIPLDLKQSNNDPVEIEPTFVKVEQELLGSYHYKIVYHKDTKVMYVVGHYSEFTVMLNADGTPMVWEGE